MATYRLVWSGDGALDLSQVLDTRGRPIVLSPQQREVSISSEVLKSPHLQRYLSTPHLKAEQLDGPKTAPLPTPPPTPVAPVAPPAAPPVAPPPVVKATPVAPPTPKPVVVDPEPILTKETLTVEKSSAEPPSPSTPPTSSSTEAKTELKGGVKGKGGRK